MEGAVFGGGRAGRMVEGGSESYGSSAGEAAGRVGGAKAEVGGLQRGAPAALESVSPDAAADRFDDELWHHIARLPTRFLLRPCFFF